MCLRGCSVCEAAVPNDTTVVALFSSSTDRGPGYTSITSVARITRGPRNGSFFLIFFKAVESPRRRIPLWTLRGIWWKLAQIPRSVQWYYAPWQMLNWNLYVCTYRYVYVCVCVLCWGVGMCLWIFINESRLLSDAFIEPTKHLGFGYQAEIVWSIHIELFDSLCATGHLSKYQELHGYPIAPTVF